MQSVEKTVRKRAPLLTRRIKTAFPSGSEWCGAHADCPLLLKSIKSYTQIFFGQKLHKCKMLITIGGKKKIIQNSLCSLQALALVRRCIYFLRWIWTAENQSYIPEKGFQIFLQSKKHRCGVRGTPWCFLCTRKKKFYSNTFHTKTHCVHP